MEVVKRLKVALLCAVSSIASIGFAYADSDASYPDGWEDWPVVKESMNLPADTVLPPDTSLFIQESVRAYAWINEGRGSPLTIRVNPSKLEQYKTHGPYTDGPTVVAVSEVDGIIWVTEHIEGLAIYGSYNRKGEDISSMHPSLDPSFCASCHTTYKDICINGTCTEPVLATYTDSKE
ncbi:hypothetical protein OPW41_05865 [Vibrio europaeus]|uniref:Cytochrome P460 domain-containing protein n=1 Tax=Vibrio europaeus TaxID=300876 RepID=A0A178J8U7_9VIBR|nr:hypothetical protein [Vibrio europaeus]MDC5705394.1 hypothetical protein [Vibrio europaeus]MDC5710673.1 hypothetical protein [Vibrio europaeus]MDC5715763.1 hypothetical protein [Vibrio europaeus]MDC5719924.1 hypothetical protein [Vibrio europaeus]MDC5724188.1 hypothetical protein [Vibrio europaeus]